MIDWLLAEGTYRNRRNEVIAFCNDAFGKEYNPRSIVRWLDKGKWFLTVYGELFFKSEKELSWFLLTAATLKDNEQDTEFWWPPGGPPGTGCTIQIGGIGGGGGAGGAGSTGMLGAGGAAGAGAAGAYILTYPPAKP